MKKICAAHALKDAVFAADACPGNLCVKDFLMELENIVANTVLLKAREGKLTHEGAENKQ